MCVPKNQRAPDKPQTAIRKDYSHSNAWTLPCLTCPPSLPQLSIAKVAVCHNNQTAILFYWFHLTTPFHWFHFCTTVLVTDFIFFQIFFSPSSPGHREQPESWAYAKAVASWVILLFFSFYQTWQQQTNKSHCFNSKQTLTTNSAKALSPPSHTHVDTHTRTHTHPHSQHIWLCSRPTSKKYKYCCYHLLKAEFHTVWKGLQLTKFNWDQ